MITEAVARARQVATQHAPEALAVLLGGSVARGQGTANSDLDIVILLPDDGRTRREALRFEGQPVELFLHTRAGLTEQFVADVSSRRGTLHSLYAESVTVHDPHGQGADLRAHALQALREGPAPLPEQVRRTRCHMLADELDDLADVTERFEQLSVGALVMHGSADLLFDHHRGWTGSGKWLSRRLLATDPELGGALLAGHLRLCETADPTALLESARAVLDLVGA